MTRKYTKWSKELLEPIIKKSKSLSQCLKQMGLRPAGGNYRNLLKNIERFELDTTHFLGQSIHKGKEFKSFENIIKPETIKRRLIKEFGHSCFKCGLHTWMDFPITLELEHIDGNNRNNSKENLELLCPNCHSQTPTWRNRKR